MKRLLAGIVILVAAFFFIRPNERAAAAQTSVPELWQVGRCYRVFPHDRDQFYRFRVLQPPNGHWVRVQPDPPTLKSPGMPPSAPLWLNANSQFAVQEWPCSD